MEKQPNSKTSMRKLSISEIERRDAWLLNKITIGELVKPGAPVLSKPALDVLMDLYSCLLDEIGYERFEEAYSLVLNTSKFRPDISELRAAAGANLQFPIEAEAKREFLDLIKLQRHHGWKLTNRGTPEKDPPLPLRRIIADVLDDMGYGDIKGGLRAVWEHPALDQVRPGEEMDSLESFRRVAGEKIERKWVEFYTRRKAEGFKREAA
jgi:hypothetical protein